MLSILGRARLRLHGVTVELDPDQCRQLHGTIQRVEQELSRLEARIPQARQGGEHVESESAHRDPGAGRPGGEPAHPPAVPALGHFSSAQIGHSSFAPKAFAQG